MEDRLLPIGTIVLLKNAGLELMIVGYKAAIETDEGDKKADYIACRLNGIKGLKSFRFFNKEDIDKIVYLGYVDDDFYKLAHIINK